MTLNHKLRESIAVGFVIGVLAFVAGAENFSSEIECERYSREQGLHEESFSSQKIKVRSVFRDSAIAERRVITK